MTAAALVLVATAIAATATVLVRDPHRQIMVYMLYGLAMTIALVVLQAPDVALSELAVGSVAIPFAVLATLIRIKHGRSQ